MKQARKNVFDILSFEECSQRMSALVSTNLWISLQMADVHQCISGFYSTVVQQGLVK